MLTIEGERAVDADASRGASRRFVENEGVLFASVLMGSWAIAIGAVWIIWRVSPL